MFDGLFANTRVYQKGLDAMWLKNQVIDNNIANFDTPGFKASHVDFESVFRDAIHKTGELQGTLTHVNHIPIGEENSIMEATPRARVVNTVMKLDGNNVDIEFEMAELYQNKAQYDYMMQKLNGAYSLLKTAIREGS